MSAGASSVVLRAYTASDIFFIRSSGPLRASFRGLVLPDVRSICGASSMLVTGRRDVKQPMAAR